MKRFFYFSKFLLFLIGFSWGLPASAGANDYVKEVYVCGNDVFIRMQTAGWMVAQEAVLGKSRLDRLLSVALTMVTSGKPSGYFDEGPTVSLCGANPKQLTVLSIKADAGS